MTRQEIISVLWHYRSKFQAARQSGDIKEARELGIITARLCADLEEVPGVEVDTEQQHEDHLLGYVRLRQLELDHIETLLRDDRPAGVRELTRWIERIQQIDVEKKEKQAS